MEKQAQRESMLPKLLSQQVADLGLELRVAFKACHMVSITTWAYRAWEMGIPG